MKNIIVTALLAFAVTSCGSPFREPEYGLVKRLRVAAIAADFPEVMPGGKVHLTATVISPKTDAYSMIWAEEKGFKPVEFGSGVETDWTAPVEEGVFPVFLYVQDDTGDREVAMKNITVSNSATPNQNPKIAIIAQPDPGIGIPVKGELKLTIDTVDPNPEDAEKIRVAWMITSGKLTDDIVPEVTWTAPSDPGVYTIYGASRDMRGGVAISQVVVTVFAP